MRLRRRPKVFCIGANKTGTTSLAAALRRLGFKIGKQAEAESLLEDWGRGDFERIVRYCRSADAFQDVPFSLPGTYVGLDDAYPAARFILTVRETPNDWFRSLTAFHTRIVGKGRLPTVDDLKAFGYREPGWLWRVLELTFGGEEVLYDRDRYTAVYQAHIDAVSEHFRDRPGDLLVLNVGDEGAARTLCDFLGERRADLVMPHLNRSDDA